MDDYVRKAMDLADAYATACAATAANRDVGNAHNATRAALQAHLAAQPAPAQVVSEASPDVAKMVKEAKRFGRRKWYDMMDEAIDLLAAAATQARAAASEPLSVSVREVRPLIDRDDRVEYCKSLAEAGWKRLNGADT